MGRFCLSLCPGGYLTIVTAAFVKPEPLTVPVIVFPLCVPVRFIGSN